MESRFLNTSKRELVMKNERITAKDLITTGLFTAIIFIVSMAVGMLGFIPIFIPLIVL